MPSQIVTSSSPKPTMATGSRPTPRLCIKTPLTIAMIIKTPDGITASGCPGTPGASSTANSREITKTKTPMASATPKKMIR